MADLADNPHRLLHQLRAREPVAWLPALQAWLVTRYDLAISVMRDAKRFTVDHPGFSTARVVGASMLSLDGDAHLRHRMPFEAPFRRKAVLSRFRQPVRRMIHARLDRLAPHGRADLQREFAAPVAAQTMLFALGLPPAILHDLLDWYDDIVDAVSLITAGEPLSREGEAAFAALRARLLPVLQQEPETSLLATAAGAARGLSADEIIANAAVLLFGGIETTEGMIANAVYHLLQEPEMMTAVSNNPDLLPDVIEESLRLEPAAAVVDRYAVTDTELGGAAIRAGELVRVSLSAANRDPAVFPDPDRFDPRRENRRAHVAFAQGPHVCLGLHLARLEAVEAVAQLLRRLPNLRLAEEGAAQAQPRGLVFRKPAELMVEWDR